VTAWSRLRNRRVLTAVSRRPTLFARLVDLVEDPSPELEIVPGAIGPRR